MVLRGPKLILNRIKLGPPQQSQFLMWLLGKMNCLLLVQRRFTLVVIIVVISGGWWSKLFCQTDLAPSLILAPPNPPGSRSIDDRGDPLALHPPHPALKTLANRAYNSNHVL